MLFTRFPLTLLMLTALMAPARPARAVDFQTAGYLVAGAGLCTLAVFAGGLGIAERINLHRTNRRHDEVAKALGKKHLGYGIYFEGESFFATFTDEDRAFLFSAETLAIEKARFHSLQLQGDYDNDHRQTDYDGIDAISFLKGRAEQRGVCRHKSVVMVAALGHLGIDAAYTRSGHHAWVTLTKEKIAFDPTNGAEQSAKSYSGVVNGNELADTLSHMYPF